MKDEAEVPFVARDRTALAIAEPAKPSHRYDERQQLWRCTTTGQPLVIRHIKSGQTRLAASEFGETTMTKTAEGVDQSEGRVDDDTNAAPQVTADIRRHSGLAASQFGETMVTETGEGVDQSERTAGF